MVAGLGWAALSGLFFGSINVAVRAQGVHPLWQTAIAYLVVAAVLAWQLRDLRVPRGDRIPLAVVAVVGGGLSPILLFMGLRETTAIDTGLLLTFELVVTALLAVVFLRERETARGWTGIAALLAAAVLAALGGTAESSTTWRGALFVGLAAVGWAVDNVLSTRLVGTYRPPQVLAVKGLVGGGLALAAALAWGVPAPGGFGLEVAVLVGGIGLAGSLLCFYRALQTIGAARTAAVNIPLTALAGGVGGVLLLQESFRLHHAAALALVVLGVVLLVPPQGSSTKPV